MNKRGFTLAEVLVTLGIIGVVTALTIPTFTAKTNAAKIGPTLSKAVAVFEQASQQILSETSSDTLLNAMVCADGTQTCDSRVAVTASDGAFWSNYKHYIKGNIATLGGDTVYTLPDGISYKLGSINSAASGDYPADTLITNYNSTSLQRTLFAIDINGWHQAPNKPAIDRFYFALYNDGSLKPAGGENWLPDAGADIKWGGQCAKNKLPITAEYCAGHIFENNLKAEYKF